MPEQPADGEMRWWDLVNLCYEPFGSLPREMLMAPVPQDATVSREEGLVFLDKFGGYVEAAIDGGFIHTQTPKTMACDWPIPFGAMARRYRLDALLQLHEGVMLLPGPAARAWLGNDDEGPWVPAKQLEKFRPAQFKYISALRSAIAVRKAAGDAPESRAMALAMANLAEAAAGAAPSIGQRLKKAAPNFSAPRLKGPFELTVDGELGIAYLWGKAISHLWTGHPQYPLFALDELPGPPEAFQYQPIQRRR